MCFLCFFFSFSFFLFSFFFFSISLYFVGNSSYLGKAKYPQVQPYHAYQYGRCFRVSKQWYSCQRFKGFLTCVQMLMHATAHGGCTDTVRESALEDNSRRKIPCRTGDSNPRQYCAWLFSRTLYPLSYPRPIRVGKWTDITGSRQTERQTDRQTRPVGKSLLRINRTG